MSLNSLTEMDRESTVPRRGCGARVSPGRRGEEALHERCMVTAGAAGGQSRGRRGGQGLAGSREGLSGQLSPGQRAGGPRYCARRSWDWRGGCQATVAGRWLPGDSRGPAYPHALAAVPQRGPGVEGMR